MNLAAAVHGRIAGMQRTLGERLSVDVPSLESAARIWVDSVYEPLAEALVLARVFVILPRGALPPPVGEHADRIARATGGTLDARSPVLTLMGTRGARPEWNERTRSQGHLAIPLASPMFVAQSPMVASLLDDLGVRVASLGSRPRLIAGARETADFPTFYVADARRSVDPRGRMVIPAREFVSAHDIRSVFGVGGLIGTAKRDAMMFAMILFSRQHVSRGVAEELTPLAAEFRRVAGHAQGPVVRGALFDEVVARDS